MFYFFLSFLLQYRFKQGDRRLRTTRLCNGAWDINTGWIPAGFIPTTFSVGLQD